MMCMVFLLVVVPYSIYPFYYFCVTMKTYKVDEAWWNSIKDHRYDVILKFQSNGVVHLDKWGQIAMGFVTFLLFGTGTDAHNTYKKMLLFFGLGKIFPSLYIMRESGSSRVLAKRKAICPSAAASAPSAAAARSTRVRAATPWRSRTWITSICVPSPAQRPSCPSAAPP
jgi:hypothetical protein